MRFKLLFFCLVSAACLAPGCKMHQISGNPDASLVAEIERHGGYPEAHGRTTDLSGHWTYERDRFGTVLRSCDAEFDQVDRFVKERYGMPSKGGNTREQQQQWVIPAKVAGVSIWYSKFGNGVQVTVMKPLRLSGDVVK
jgi:hypothetical protein